MNYHNISKDDMLNGDGLRAVLWVSGCNHGCAQCHNSITWDINCGVVFDEEAKQELFIELNKDYISGVTFSGGDPLHPANRSDIGRLARTIKEKYPNKTIWLYTGYVWEEIKELEFLDSIDVLVDGRFIIEQMDPKLHWKGSCNQKVINVKESLKKNEIVLHHTNEEKKS